MRIDLFTGGRRSWPMRAGLALARHHLGIDPGPPTALTFRPDLLPRSFMGYILGSAHAGGRWDKGHIEMFSAFVSKLNSCHF